MMLRFLPIPEKFVVFPDAPSTLHPSIKKDVDEIWQAECDRRGTKLFDGPIFSVEHLCAPTLSGRFVGYRHFIAQERRPELFSSLRVKPLAVTGVLQNADGLFFGFRDSSVAVQADCWELIPSGGVDRSTTAEGGQLCPGKQVLTELWEEVGISREAVAPPRLVCFAEDPRSHIYELIWELTTWMDADAVLRAHAKLSHPEHSKIEFLRWADLEGFLAHSADRVLPASRELVQHLMKSR